MVLKQYSENYLITHINFLPMFVSLTPNLIQEPSSPPATLVICVLKIRAKEAAIMQCLSPQHASSSRLSYIIIQVIVDHQYLARNGDQMILLHLLK